MRPLGFGPATVERILVLGAHADDIEIGCGGTILKLLAARSGVRVRWVVFTAPEAERAKEARASAASFLAGAADYDVSVLGLRDAFLPYRGEEVKEQFEALKAFDPDLVLTHTSDDRHQDHRLLWELTWNTFRDHLVLEYEIPKYDGDLGRPNLYVPLERELVEQKIELLLRHFGTQASRRWFDDETFRGLMRLRGMEANAVEGFAEAFVARKAVIDL